MQQHANRDTVRQSRLKDIRAKNFQGSEQELEQILKSVLKVRSDASQTGAKQDSEIEATATIKAKDEVNELVINIRKKIDSITVRAPIISRLNNVSLRNTTATRRNYNSIPKRRPNHRTFRMDGPHALTHRCIRAPNLNPNHPTASRRKINQGPANQSR